MSLKRLKIIAATALIAGAALFSTGQAAQATPVQPAPIACQFGTQSEFVASADVWTSTDCVGSLSNNDNATTLNSYGASGIFGTSNWVLNTKYEKDSASYGPSGLMTITNITGDFFQGDWTISSWSGVSAAVLVLKGGNGFAAYLLDISAGLTGQWITQVLLNGGGKQPQISHVSLYTSAGMPPSSVPLPAAGLLMIGALGGLGLLRRRRKTP